MNRPPVWIAAAFAATVIYVATVQVLIQAAYIAWCKEKTVGHCGPR